MTSEERVGKLRSIGTWLKRAVLHQGLPARPDEDHVLPFSALHVGQVDTQDIPRRQQAREFFWQNRGHFFRNRRTAQAEGPRVRLLRLIRKGRV